PPAARPVHGRRHPEPHRVRGHLPAARGTARPFPLQAVGRLPQPRAGAGGPGPARPRPRSPRHGGRRRAPGGDRGRHRGSQRSPPREPGGPGGPRLHRPAGPGDAGGAGGDARGLAAGRGDGAARGEGVGLAGRAAVRDARRGQGRGQAVRPPPDPAPARARARGDHRGRRARRHPRRRAGAALTVAAPRTPADRRGVAPTRRLALVTALASAAVLAAPGGGVARLLAVNAAVLAVAAVDAGLAPATGSLPVRRELPAAVTLGREAEVAWRVANPTGRHLRVALADELAPSLRADTRRARGRVPPGGTLRAVTVIRPARRGRFPLRHLVVRVDGPL